MAERSNVKVCNRSLAGIAGSNPSEARLSVACESCVLSCIGLATS
jgi:hypothetical protein